MGPAFNCTTPTSFLSQGTPSTQLYFSTYGSGSVTYQTLGSAYSATYNSLGFDPTDNYLYTITLGSNTLLKIDSTGAVTNLGAVTGLPINSNQPSNGAFDGTTSGANFWVTGGNGSTTAYEINVASTPPAVMKTVTLSKAWQPIDFTAGSGYMWGLSGTTIYRVDLIDAASGSTAIVSTFNAPSQVVSGNFGAAWTFSNGNVGFSNNGNGDIYQISIANPTTSSPIFTVISSYTGPVAGSSNDGAACVAPLTVDLGITKTGPLLPVTPGSTISWTLTVTNNGPGNSSGFGVTDSVPSVVTNVTSPTSGCKVTGNNVLCSEGALANGGTFTITITGTAPTSFGTCFINSATVTGNEADPNSANNTASAPQTCTNPAISIVKSATPSTYSAPGTTIHYSYLVTNPSTTTTITSVTVKDPMPGLVGLSCPTGTLAAGASETCTATYTTTQADVDAGSLNNTGTATAAGNLSATSSLTIPAVQNPAISVVKTANVGAYNAPGVPVTYSYKVTNSGNVTLTSVGISDPMSGLSAINCPSTTLNVAANETCTATYTTTQSDVDAGKITNTGTASGTSPKGTVVTAQSSVTINGTRTPGIGVVKAASPTTFSAPGVSVTYSYTVTNTGNVTLTSVGVSDPMSGLSAIRCPSSTLSPHATQTCTASYTTTQADVDRGSIFNTGTATGTPPSGSAVTAQSSTTVTATQSPAITILKTASITSYSAAGVPVTYSYLVTNTGNVTLTSVHVTDPMGGLSSVSCASSTLAPGASQTCTATYTTTSADVERGSITNSATASGTSTTGTVTSGPSAVTIPLQAKPSIALVKSASITGFSATGVPITYSYLVTNTGNTALTSVGVTDPMSGLSSVSCPSSTLAIGASETCTATYTTSLADLNRGSITNTGTASGTGKGTVVTAQSSVTIPATQNPAITLLKTSSIPGFNAAGVSVTYSYRVTNSGNVTLSGIGVTDPMTGLSSVSCPSGSLVPAAFEICSATYTTTQADVDRGSINNTGTASGTSPKGTNVTAQSSVSVPATQTSRINLVKTANIGSFNAPGSAVTYSYLVTNTGNTTLTSVAVTDPMTGLSAIACPLSTLLPGHSVTCAATYTTTQADVDRGSINNTGTASATPPTGPPVTAQSSLSIPAVQTPLITVTKTASISGFNAPNLGVTYTYRVANIGNVTLTSVHVTDPMTGLSAISCPTTTLAVGAVEMCTATYTTTQTDVDRGAITNTATASGTSSSAPVTSAPSTVTIPGTQSPSIAVAKSADISSYSAPGTLIHYSYLVTNNGNVTLTSVHVTDPMTGLSAVTCASSTLAVAASETCTATYTTTLADVDRGSITNTGTAAGTPPTGAPVSAQSKLVISAVQAPAIALNKTALPVSFNAPGTVISYSYLVTNTGNTSLQGIRVTDPMAGLSSIFCPETVLAPNATETCTATYTTTQADVDAGSISNTGTASGTSKQGVTVQAESTARVTAVRSYDIALVKTSDTPSYSEPGLHITYHYQVTNEGNVTLNPVTVTDPMVGLSAISCPATSLAPGVSETCAATYITTQADVDAGKITNTGTATGTTPTGLDISASYSVTIEAVLAPAIAITKSALEPNFNGPNQTIHYSYSVSNIGNETLDPVTVTDPMIGLSAITCPDTSLSPGAVEVCQATYTTTQADVDAGKITNVATATGTPASGPNVVDHSTLILPARQNPSITLVKTASPGSFSGPAQTLTYSYEVTNSGNVTLSSLIVTDPMTGLSAISCPGPTLAVGATETCTATYTTTQTDVDRGAITNTGTAAANPPIGPPISVRSTTTVPADLNPAIELAKSASIVNFNSAHTLITYSYDVINAGNVTISAIAVTDPMAGLSTISCPSPDLAVGASETCTATYATTQADVDRGYISNTGTVTGRGPLGQPLSDDASLTLPALQQPLIGLVKSANIGSFTVAGRPVTYAYTVTNTGNVTLTSVDVTDSMTGNGLSAISCPTSILAPTQSEACTAHYTTTQADVDAGGITNIATASGNPPSGPAVSDTSTLTIPSLSKPGISLDKSASVTSFSATSTLITYSYLVTNSGNKTLHAIAVVDPMSRLSAVTCPDPTLLPGASETCTATYTTTQDDLDNGGITNTATASGTPPTGAAVTDTATLTVPATQTPAITVVKSADTTDFNAAALPIEYSYTVTNSGNITLHSVSVTDPMVGLSPVLCPDTTLLPGASETCTADYTTTQADLDNGRIVNTGTANALGPENQPVADSSTLTIPALRSPQIHVVKSADISGFSAAGIPVVYSYDVTNTGNVTLTSVSVTDPMTGLSAVTCPESTLAPGDSEICTADYTTTQADVDNGAISNTGTATGAPPDSLTVPTDQSSLTISGTRTPGISVDKTASIVNFNASNVPVTYTYTVTNSGNVTLHDVTVADPMIGLSTVTCPDSTLAPGDSEACTASYTTTQADLDRGSISNTGTATGTPPSGPTVSDSSTVTISGTTTPGIALIKSSDLSTFDVSGTLVVYNYLVTNTGNVTLNPVTVTDPMPGLSSISCPDTGLPPGGSETCSASYTILQTDVDRGSISNTGTATGTPPSGPTVSANSSLTIPLSQEPDISVNKSASITSYNSAGTAVTYSYLVTNSGNVTLQNVTVTDPMTGLSPITCPDTVLAPAASETCSASYTTIQADVDRGSISNTATASGTPPTGAPVSDTSSLTIDAAQTPGLTMVKSDDTPSFSTPGTTVTYSYTVTNTGNVTLTSLHVTDPLPGLSSATCPITPLPPLGTAVCHATYSTTQGDLDAGGISNTATASGTPPSGPPLTTTPSSTFIPAIQSPSISLVKSASVSTYSAPGTTITYRYLVMNTGNVTLSGVFVDDPMPGLSGIACTRANLPPDGFETCTATYITTRADVDAGQITNTAAASGSPPVGAPVTATAHLTVTATQRPGISIVKSADISSYNSPGTPVVYTYSVTNTGNVTLSPVTVTDPMPGLSPIDCHSTTSLPPGGTETCTASYSTTQADVDAGNLSNTGTADGAPPIGAHVRASSTVTLDGQQAPAITLVKTASINTFAAAATPITYSYLVTNTGNVTLSPVTVTDPMPGLSAIDCHGITSLAPAAFETCTATYTTTPGDLDAGTIFNTGTATGTPPSGPTVASTSSVTIPAEQEPAIGLVKTASIPSFDATHVLITYRYQVTNSGNVTLHAVGVTDAMPGLSTVSCPTAKLATGASETCTATYTTTQADLDRGSITNIATATGTPPAGPAVSTSASASVTAGVTPGISLTKTADTPSFASDGIVITYHYDVTNTGNVTLDPVTISDPMPGLSTIDCHSVTSLAPTDFVICDATYTTTTGDINAGLVDNTAMAIGTPPTGSDVTATSEVSVPGIQHPAVGVVKSAVPSGFSGPGVTLNYSFRVSNIGNVDVHSVVVSDLLPNISAVTCPSDTLAIGAVEICSATYVTTQADLDAGKIVNTATATALGPDDQPVTPDSSTLVTPATQVKTIGIVKSADVPNFSTSGVPIIYSYLVTNTGNVTLTSVSVADPMPGLSAVSCPQGTLAPGADETCSATYLTTQADVDNTGITNSGTASGTPPSGPPVSASSILTIPATQAPAITIVKSALQSDFSEADASIGYIYTVTNTGNVTLDAVTVVDRRAGLSAIDCPDLTLAPGASEVCTATYTTSQTDLDNGGVTNTATASGTTPAGRQVTDSSTITVPAIVNASITIVKSAVPASFSHPGTLITYSYMVTDSGNVSLSDVSVSDPMSNLSAISCPFNTLSPGQTTTCTATYTTTQADVDNGQITNTGTATGTPPSGVPVTDSSTLALPAVQTIALNIVKSAEPTTFDSAGTLITYTFVATNVGNVTLHTIALADKLGELSDLNCPEFTPPTAIPPTFDLLPGDSFTCTATYTTTQADVDSSGLVNTAVVTGVGPEAQTPTDSDTVDVTPVQTPSMTVVKTANPPDFPGAGAKITYSYTVTNTGNVTLHSITVADPMSGLSAVTCPTTPVAPGASTTCTATYTTTADDVARGSITNSAAATGTAPSGQDVTAETSLTVESDGLSLHKSASVTSFDKPGVVVHYTYVVTNTGDLALASVKVTDAMPGLSAITCPADSLAPRASMTCTAAYTTTQADLDRGSISNVGTATGQPPTGPEVSVTSTVTVPAVTTPSLTLAKTASIATFSAAGTEIAYSYKITNTGNVTLGSVTVDDPMSGLSAVDCPTAVLAPGASEVCTATYTTTDVDVGDGQIINTATASAKIPGGAQVTSKASSVTVAYSAPPAPPSPITPEPLPVTG